MRSSWRKARIGSHVHLVPIDEGSTRLYPDGPYEYATDFPHRLPKPCDSSGRYTYHSVHAHRTTNPNPPGFESAPPNEASDTGSFRMHSHLAHRARTIWQY
jgi:hypothetical protein